MSYLLLLQGRLVSDDVSFLQQLFLVLLKLLLSLTRQKVSVFKPTEQHLGHHDQTLTNRNVLFSGFIF